MPSGTNGSTAAPALNLDAVRQRIEELRSEFDVVMIDAAPAHLYADAVAFGRFSDGIILVLQSNTTRREAALKAKQSCEIANVRLLGAVLNKRTYPIPQHLYDRL
jgi:Mrp family chromosome partitioning ATPase